MIKKILICSSLLLMFLGIYQNYFNNMINTDVETCEKTDNFDSNFIYNKVSYTTIKNSQTTISGSITNKTGKKLSINKIHSYISLIGIKVDDRVINLDKPMVFNDTQNEQNFETLVHLPKIPSIHLTVSLELSFIDENSKREGCARVKIHL